MSHFSRSRVLVHALADNLWSCNAYLCREIRQAKPVRCHEVRTDEDKAALPEAVRSRGLPTNLGVIRLIEISGCVHVHTTPHTRSREPFNTHRSSFYMRAETEWT